MDTFERTPIGRREDLAELFHENTKYFRYQVERAARDEVDDANLPTVVARRYLRPDQGLTLPDPADPDTPVGRAIRTRRSSRAYAEASIQAPDLASVLHHGYGPAGHGRRHAPSAGARYPLELFVAIRAVEGLDAGFYHYHADGHALEPLGGADAFAQTVAAFADQPGLDRAAAIVVVAGVFARTGSKYGERGYRLVLLDAGHAMQNMQLTAHALGLAHTALGGFIDDELNALASLDGADEGVLCGLALGLPAASP